MGFPVARIGALIGLASGAVLRYQVAACEGKGTGEQSLLQNLLVHLNADDVLLADALLATWWIVEGARRRGAEGISRKRQEWTSYATKISAESVTFPN